VAEIDHATTPSAATQETNRNSRRDKSLRAPSQRTSRQSSLSGQDRTVTCCNEIKGTPLGAAGALKWRVLGAPIVGKPARRLVTSADSAGACDPRPIVSGAMSLRPESAMNKDQVKGAIKEAAGKVQEKTGEVVGSKTQQAKGLAREAEGKAQKAAGDVKDALKKR